MLLGPPKRHALLPLLVLVLAAEGWLVAGSIWQRASTADSAAVEAAVQATRSAGDSPLSRFMAAPRTDAETDQVRAIMKIYLERYRKDYLQQGREEAGDSPYLHEVGPASPREEIDALSRFIEEQGFRMLEDFRGRTGGSAESGGGADTGISRFPGMRGVLAPL